MLWPAARRQVEPVAVFRAVTAAVAPPPEYENPPLWGDPRAVERLADIAWPPERERREAS